MNRRETFDDDITRARAVPIEDVIARRGIKLNGKGAERFGPCPKCDGTDRFSINIKKRVFNCQCRAGGDVIALVRFLDGCDHRKAVQLLAGKQAAENGDVDEERCIDWRHGQHFLYHDCDGNVAYRNTRYPLIHRDGSPVIAAKGKPDKTFLLSHLDHGEWVKGLTGIAQVPYQLHNLIEDLAADRTVPVFIPEGEGKADLIREWGLTATYIAKGTTEYAGHFRDAVVILLRDADKSGQYYVDRVGSELQGFAREVRMLALPGRPDSGDDVKDWAAAGGTADELRALAEEAPLWGREPRPGEDDRGHDREGAGAINGPEAPAYAFSPTWLDDVSIDEEPAYIVDKVIPAGPSFGLIPAPPKSLKSFFLTDLLMHIAIGKPYAGRAVQPGIVAYVTSEGVSGVKRRLVAMRRHHGVEGKKVPFALVPVMPNLGSGGEDRDKLITAIRTATAGLKSTVRVIVIDTLRRATTGKSENKPEDMSVFIANCEAIAAAFKCFVGAAHHSPRSDEGRSSGTNALDAAADVILSVTRCDVGGVPRATVTVARMKDGDEGATWTFELKTMTVGVDRNGKLKVGGYVIVIDQSSVTERADEPKTKKLPKGAPIALRALREAIDECGVVPPVCNHIPRNVKTVSIDQWRTYAYQRGISTGEDRAKQKAFKTATAALIENQSVGCWNEQVWPAK